MTMNYLLPLFSLTVLALSITACQANQTSEPNQMVEQKEVTFDKPVLQEPMLQQELKSDNPIKIAKQSMTLSEKLEQYNWQLTNAVDDKNQTITILMQNPKPVVLDFYTENVEGKIYYKVGFYVGCNSMDGSYKVNNSELSIGTITGTEMYCEGIYEAESKLAKLMDGKSNLTFNEQTLTQTTANGSTLTWQGTLTDEAKYGKSETIFLEVAPNMEHCSSGIDQKCLKVRDVSYNDNWIKSGYSDWRLMKQPIEGYSHDSKYRKLLRVKKYITDPIDVRGKQLVYVLDMVVETGVVK